MSVSARSMLANQNDGAPVNPVRVRAVTSLQDLGRRKPKETPLAGRAMGVLTRETMDAWKIRIPGRCFSPDAGALGCHPPAERFRRCGEGKELRGEASEMPEKSHLCQLLILQGL